MHPDRTRPPFPPVAAWRNVNPGTARAHSCKNITHVVQPQHHVRHQASSATRTSPPRIPLGSVPLSEIESAKKGLGVGNTDSSDGPDEKSLSDVLRAAVEGQDSESPAPGKVAGTKSSRSSRGGSGHSHDSASDAHKLSQSCSSQSNGAGSDASRTERRMRLRHTSGSIGLSLIHI